MYPNIILTKYTEYTNTQQSFISPRYQSLFEAICQIIC